MPPTHSGFPSGFRRHLVGFARYATFIGFEGLKARMKLRQLFLLARWSSIDRFQTSAVTGEP